MGKGRKRRRKKSLLQTHTKQKNIDPMMSQHKAPRKRVCEEEEERMLNAVGVVAWDDGEEEDEGEV
jgi:hypothetical protein